MKNTTFPELSGNFYTLKNTTFPELSGNFYTLKNTTFPELSGNFYTLKNTVAGISGNVSAIKFNAEAIFKKTADLWYMQSAASTTIDYSFGSTVSLSNTATGPYTYNITNVPDVSLNSHILTIFTQAGPLNTSTCYGNVITVNNGTNKYTLLWSNGENPASTMSTVQVGDIVTQQIALLPTDFSRNVAMSAVSFYRKG